MHSFNLYNLTKSYKWFIWSGSCIDLILTNKKYCFKHTSTFERGVNNHHHLIYSTLKTTFKKKESKEFIYCKNFDNANFQMDLESKLNNCPKKIWKLSKNSWRCFKCSSTKENWIRNLTLTKIFAKPLWKVCS